MTGPLVQLTWILPIKALTVTLMFNLSPSILARQSWQVQGLEPMLCLEIISRSQVLQALCPQGMDTGWFINSLLEWNRTDKKIVVCAKKKRPKIWTAIRNKSKQTVPYSKDEIVWSSREVLQVAFFRCWEFLMVAFYCCCCCCCSNLNSIFL